MAKPVLLIETSTERGAVFILEGKRVLYRSEFPFGLNNSKHAMPAIQEGLAQNQISVADLLFIGVGIGPGSYTGIRVGAITAKTLGYACRVPVVGVCTLSCFVPSNDAAFAALIDAKTGGVYCLRGIKKAGKVEHFYPAQIMRLEELDNSLSHERVLVSPNSIQLKAKLHKLFPSNSWEWQETGPDALHMAAVAREKFQRGEFSPDGKLDLMYLRKTQAEIERDSKRGTGSYRFR